MNKTKIVFVIFILFALAGCSQQKKQTMQTTPPSQATVNINNIRSICQMATLKCYYHNVAKSTKSAGTGLFRLGEKERKFWIDYTGIAEISYDINKIQMEVEGNTIILTLPQPTVTCNVDPGSWHPGSYIISKDGFNKNPITAEDQQQAIKNAQAIMQSKVAQNASLLSAAEAQAHELIENYINQVGKATRTEYTIIWQSAE